MGRGDAERTGDPLEMFGARAFSPRFIVVDEGLRDLRDLSQLVARHVALKTPTTYRAADHLIDRVSGPVAVSRERMGGKVKARHSG
ncbi:hypothetical protein M2321_002650 [Rhodoblastus acidophilus]|jgi:hypothetical protein|nr:hypothetical protein [Rhodoblastus acidophilus]MCW2275067.1 hypothetical protein [Rhodoblastus acidophilus]